MSVCDCVSVCVCVTFRYKCPPISSFSFFPFILVHFLVALIRLSFSPLFASFSLSLHRCQPHSMSTIWEFLEWVANTLVFMVAGMIVGRYIVNFATPVEYG